MSGCINMAVRIIEAERSQAASAKVIMKNEHGVVLRMRGTEQGVKLTLGPQGARIKLKG